MTGFEVKLAYCVLKSTTSMKKKVAKINVEKAQPL